MADFKGPRSRSFPTPSAALCNDPLSPPAQVALAAPLDDWHFHAPAVSASDKVGDAPAVCLRLTLSRNWRNYAGHLAALSGLAALALAPFAIPPHRVAPRLAAASTVLLAVATARSALHARRGAHAPAGPTALDAYALGCVAFVAATLVAHVAAWAERGTDRAALDTPLALLFAALWLAAHAALALRARHRLAAIRATFGDPWDQATLVPPALRAADHVATQARLPSVLS